ncbi:DUF3397 domain-containing protein [Fictibacillus iocasae]|uniref:DUF3397 domain-containing protein n=1 Tax=Fictibacillus iocasae TaxID=2715437 RepID=A0ABW2NSU6_9BACL
MATFAGGVLGIFAAAPFLLYMIVHAFMKRRTKKHRRPAVAARDATTFVLFLSVYRLNVEIFHKPFVWGMLLAFLIGCIGVSIVLWKMEKEITAWKLLKINWRLQFLILSAAYACLIVYGIIDRINTV